MLNRKILLHRFSLIFFIVIFFFNASIAKAADPYGQTGSWTMVFNDEFDTASLNLSKWEPNWLAGNDTAITKPINSSEASCYDPSQVSISGGSLKLSAVQRSCKATNGVTYSYASGIVTSRPHFTLNYGYIEARMWLDGTTAAIKNWPAFWTDGTGTWPITGEIDIMEGLGGTASWHYHCCDPHWSTGAHPSLSNQSGWHIYAADWEPGIIKYYYDGSIVGQVTTNVVNASHFLILNYGVSSSISPPIQVPSNILIDYVRVWKPASITPTATLKPTTTPTPRVTPTPIPPTPTAAQVTLSPGPTGTGKLGDANLDGKVDGIDYTVWLNHYQPGAIQSGGRAIADFNMDAYIDGVDYTIWLTSYGK